MKINDFKDIPTVDLILKRILWPDDNENNLGIVFANFKDEMFEFNFKWTMDLIINLDFKDMAQVFTWDIETKRNEKGIWEIVCDFPGNGFISLKCNEIEYQKL